MDRQQLETEITFIVRELADDETLVLDTAMTAADLPRWDSFTQVEFVAALESRFYVLLPLPEVAAWQTLGDAVASVALRTANREV